MLPRRAEVQFLTVSHGREGAFSAKAGQWAAELQRLLAGTSGTFSALITALNPPTSGPDTRTVGTFITRENFRQVLKEQGIRE